MDYNLAKKLKDAGFPQNVWSFELCSFAFEDETKELHLLHSDNDEGGLVGNSYELREKDNVSVTKCPTLSELIKACGDRFYGLKKYKEVWEASEIDEHAYINPAAIGGSPEEAVANLWLALNIKK